jgi:hypothetical protein
MKPDDFLSETDWIGCGVDNHPKDCLCDVRVDATEVPINVRCLVQGMKYGEEICDIRGYSKMWDDAQIVDYLADLLYANDEMRKWSGVLEHYNPESRDIDTVGRRVSDWKSIRTTAEAMLSAPNRPKVRQVLIVLGITAQQFTRAVSTNKFEMDDKTLDEFERVILDGTPKISHVAKQFGMSFDITRNLMTYWGILPKINRKGKQ